jgi:hypothetical protein
VQIKRNPPPKLNASIPEVEPGSVTAVDVPDYMNVTFTGDLSIALIREERHTYDRRQTAIATLYERTLPELNRKGKSSFSLPNPLVLQLSTDHFIHQTNILPFRLAHLHIPD